MLKLSKKTDYAIILLTHLGEAEDPVSAQEVATHYKLPYPMVANILKQLVSSGLIVSTRGQRGGYVLVEINLSEIIQATDSNFELVECVHDEELCKVHQYCPTRRPLIALHYKIQQFVEETALSSIIRDSQPINLTVEETSYEAANLS
ncbi:MAG TPA: Rrf2 family transcriptional regulator [Candidatus Lambdaproteobacteria bacterium]|nr:Rrf2 family transcriptional regulator [Candidatus Lambdaproteobacteria bacterium]